MSDEFFVLLVEKFATPEFQHLGVLMGIPENQNSDIFADTTFPNHQYKVLRVGISKFRDVFLYLESFHQIDVELVVIFNDNTRNRKKLNTFHFNVFPRC